MLEENLALKNLYDESDFRGNIIRIAKIRRSDCVLFLCNSNEKQIENYISKTCDSFQKVQKLSDLKGQENASFDVLFYFQGKSEDDFLSEGMEELFAQMKRVAKPSFQLYFAVRNPDAVKEIINVNGNFKGSGQSLQTWKDGLRNHFHSGKVQSYYPYPDHYFPIAFYSDDHLPKEGELDWSIYDDGNDKVALCREDALLNQFVSLGLFQQFNNSYLFSVQQNREHVEPVFVKFSNERDQRFQIATELYQNRVFKKAIGHEGNEHITHMIEMEDKLNKVYENYLKVNHCEKTDDSGQIEMEFVNGTTLEKLIDEALEAGDHERFYALTDQYVSKCFPKDKMVKYIFSPEMEEVFGVHEDDLFEMDLCLPVSSVDMIFENVVIEEESWNLLDYEWSFEFLIPYHFILYRTLFYFYQNRAGLLENIDLYKRYGISEKMKEKYFSMELKFQEYICGNKLPLRDELNLAAGIQGIPFNHEILIDLKGETDNSFHLKCTTEKKKRILPVNQKLKDFFIYSNKEAVVLEMDSVTVDGKYILKEVLKEQNKELLWLDDTTVVLEKNVSLSIPVSEEMIKEIAIVYSAYPLPDSFAFKLKKMVTDLSLTVKYFKERIEHIENKAIYKLYKKIKK